MRFVIIYKVSIIKISFDLILNFKVLLLRESLVFYKHVYIYLSAQSQNKSPNMHIFCFSFSYYLFCAKRKYYTFFKLFYDDFMNNKDSNLLSIIYGCKEFFFICED